MSEIPHQEQILRPVPERVITRFLNGVGNHEIKLLIGGLLLSESERSHTGVSIASRLNTELEQDLRLTSTTVNNFCHNSLDLISRIIAPAQPRGWQARTEHWKENAALIGFLGEWSLRWAAVSLQSIFGTSRSSGSIRSPETRYHIFDAIEEAQADKPLSIPELLGQFDPKHHGTIEVQITCLQGLNFIDKQSTYSGIDPALQLETKGLKNNKTSLLTLHKLVAEPIIDLLQGLRAINEGENLDAYADFANEMYSNPKYVRTLVEKGKAFSPYSDRSNKDDVKGSLYSLLNSHDGLTQKQARKLLNEHQNRNFSEQYVRELLRDMTQTGRLTATRSRKDSNSHVTSLVYRLADQQSKQKRKKRARKSKS